MTQTNKRSTIGLPAIGAMGVLTLGACGGDGGSDTPTPTVSIAASPASIAAGQSATLTWSSTSAATCTAAGSWAGAQPTSGTAAVSPPATGSYSYSLTCASNAGTSASGSATLTVTPAPLAIVTGALPGGLVGTAFSETIQASGGVAPFVWKVASGTLPHALALLPSSTSTVTVSGTPDTAVQGAAFTIEVSDSAQRTASQAYAVSILLQPDSLKIVPGNLDFGNATVGGAGGAVTETLTNTAASGMLINGITVSPGSTQLGEFAQTGTTCGTSLGAGASCTITVSFAPAQAGPRSAFLTISDDTAGSPQSIALYGVGLTSTPNATLTAVSLDFGIERVGTTSPPQSIALTNFSTLALNVSNIAANAVFAETNDCLPTLAPSASCTISVTFAPGGSGSVNGTLSVSDDAAGGVQKVTLSGTGSTNTPALTGSCVVLCGRQLDAAECPVGQPSATPISVSTCPFGPAPGASTSIDKSSHCSVIVNTPDPHQLFGHCGTGP